MFVRSLLTSIILLASGSLAHYYGGGHGNSSAMMAGSSGSAVNAVASWTRSARPSGTSSPGPVMVQVVQVSSSNGSSALKYFPDKIRAPAGSWIQFQFHAKNHTVTQSTFDNPCVPINSIMSNVTGIKSGFMPVSANATNVTTISVLVNDTNPVWLYCGQTGHCQNGMSMVINEQHHSNKTLEAYKAAAKMVAIAGSSATIMSNATMTSTAAVTPSTSTLSVVVTASMAVTSSVSLVIGSPTSSALPTFTGAATRRVAGGSGLTGLLVAGLAFVL